MTNGVVERINTRLRMIARRAFGFHGPGPLMAMLLVCCGGITQTPPFMGIRLLTEPLQNRVLTGHRRLGDPPPTGRPALGRRRDG